jgi:SAM-dependent methyltransferase
MSEADNYIDINRESWNARTPVHLESDFYDVESFVGGKTSLNKIELDLLGGVKGKKILHLQCHFRQDSISLARMGAEVTAVDFSDVAIDAANKLAEKCGEKVEFICADVFSLPEVLEGKFDLIFTTYGVIGWLPDLNKWANIISHFLKEDGELLLVEFHPFIWMFDDDFNDIVFTYHQTEPIVEQSEGTYTDMDADIVQKYISWNHSLSEVFEALKKKSLPVHDFKEYNYSPYACFKGVVEFEKGRYRIEKFGDKIPMVYSMKASNSND